MERPSLSFIAAIMTTLFLGAPSLRASELQKVDCKIDFYLTTGLKTATLSGDTSQGEYVFNNAPFEIEGIKGKLLVLHNPETFGTVASLRFMPDFVANAEEKSDPQALGGTKRVTIYLGGPLLRQIDERLTQLFVSCLVSPKEG
ncbi:MAG: hypothetical protein AB7T49_14105 [Oligoflexales bacterium]